MIFINTGATRLVFLTKTKAIKVPRIYGYSKFYGFLISVLSGWEANRTEYKWSSQRVHLTILCPVRYSFLFSLIIVMDRLESITEDEFKSISNIGFGGYEHKCDSFGKDKDGNILILDYGSC